MWHKPIIRSFEMKWEEEDAKKKNPTQKTNAFLLQEVRHHCLNSSVSRPLGFSAEYLPLDTHRLAPRGQLKYTQTRPHPHPLSPLASESDASWRIKDSIQMINRIYRSRCFWWTHLPVECHTVVPTKEPLLRIHHLCHFQVRPVDVVVKIG